MPHTILVIDDDEDLLATVSLALRTEGFDVETAAGGKEGLEKAVASPPDLVVLDIMMPDMNGSEVAKQLKANEATSAIPIVMITALQEKKYMKAAIQQFGVEYYIVKPFEMDDFVNKVRYALESTDP